MKPELKMLLDATPQEQLVAMLTRFRRMRRMYVCVGNPNGVNFIMHRHEAVVAVKARIK